MFRFNFLLFSIICLFGCDSQNSSNPIILSDTPVHSTQEKLEQGEKIAQTLQIALINRLSQAIDDFGISGAMDFCSLHALSITDSIAGQHKVTAQRLSHRFRNPKNQALGEDLHIIQTYLSKEESQEEKMPIIKNQEDGSWIFYKPILVGMPLCLSCHGMPGIDIQSQDYIHIQLKYPGDLAHHFHLNELRGVWKIQFPQSTPSL